MTRVDILCDHSGMDDLDSRSGRLRAARVAAGYKSSRKAALEIKLAYSTYNAHENGQNDYSFEQAIEYGLLFGVTPLWLYKGEGARTASEADVMERHQFQTPETDAAFDNIIGKNAIIGEAIKFARVTTPVLGLSAGGSDGQFLLNGDRAGSVLTPLTLASVEGAYAVYVHGDSMHPKFRSGQTIVAAPKVPIYKDDFVIVQLKPLYVGEPPRGYVKQYKGNDKNRLVLYQLNPPEGEDNTLTFEMKNVFSIHKVISTFEL